MIACIVSVTESDGIGDYDSHSGWSVTIRVILSVMEILTVTDSDCVLSLRVNVSVMVILTMTCLSLKVIAPVTMILTLTVLSLRVTLAPDWYQRFVEVRSWSVNRSI